MIDQPKKGKKWPIAVLVAVAATAVVDAAAQFELIAPALAGMLRNLAGALALL